MIKFRIFYKIGGVFMEEVFFGEAFNKVMSYLHNKNVPVKLVYNDDSEQTVKIITFDSYHLFCKDIEEEDSFIVLKHSLKRIETEVKLDKVVEKVKK